MYIHIRIFLYNIYVSTIHILPPTGRTVATTRVCHFWWIRKNFDLYSHSKWAPQHSEMSLSCSQPIRPRFVTHTQTHLHEAFAHWNRQLKLLASETCRMQWFVTGQIKIWGISCESFNSLAGDLFFYFRCCWCFLGKCLACLPLVR